MKLAQWLAEAARKLEASGIPDAKLEAQVLAAHEMGVSRAVLLTRLNDSVNLSIRGVEQRCRLVPLAYITGFREFFGREFSVEWGCLVPRQETETIVEACLDIEWTHALDIGSGTGCIGVTLAAERPAANIICCDVNPVARGLTQKNAQRLGVSVTLLDSFEDSPLVQLIVSNPPYVSPRDTLAADVAWYEDPVALYAPEDGLGTYGWLLDSARSKLESGGHMVLEVGDNSLSGLKSLIAAPWTLKRIVDDLSGRPRALVLQKS